MSDRRPVDFEKNALRIGDEIIYIPYQGGGLVRGTVYGFTPQKIRCLAKGELPTSTYGHSGKTYPNFINRPPCDVIKVKPDL